MSCIDCEKIQDEHKVAYIRWGNANILLSGCRKHLTEVIEVLRKAQEKDPSK